MSRASSTPLVRTRMTPFWGVTMEQRPTIAGLAHIWDGSARRPQLCHGKLAEERLWQHAACDSRCHQGGLVQQRPAPEPAPQLPPPRLEASWLFGLIVGAPVDLSLIHISEPTRQAEISYAVFC